MTIAATIAPDVTAPAGWILNRSLVGTADERIILIRNRDVDARYELYWHDERLHVDATRWRAHDTSDYGRFEYTPGWLRMAGGDHTAISHHDFAAVLAVAEAEWARR